MSVDVEVYEDEGGARPFDAWFDALPAAHAARVTTAIVRLGAGARSGLKPVGQGVSEWRIDWGPGIRIYLAFDGMKLVILLGGGTKTRQQSDIAQALRRWADYKRRKKAKE
jgi:putative addiction module killer protein